MRAQRIFFILVFSIVLFLVYFGFRTQAGTGENTVGFAWAETIGWVSFNSVSDGSPISYGVNIDPGSGDLSGYAWSENIGWISFERADTGNPPQDPFMSGTGNDPIAQKDLSGNLTGWMRVLANGGGWDGWIKFQNASIDTNGDWHGWAWSNMVVGWLSFNSTDPGAEGGSAYKVSLLNQPPTASNLREGPDLYCEIPARHVFYWDYSGPESGDTQSKFQLQVDTDIGFDDLEVNLIVENDSTSQQIPVYASPAPNQLVYNTTYHWRIKVWDSQGAESSWVQGSDFTTEPHHYPSVNFEPIPANPSVEEETLLDNLSLCYDINNEPIVCPANAWLWTIPADATYEEETSSSFEEPIVMFNSSGENPVILQVTDADSSCTLIKTINVGIKLPWWKEVLPW